MKSIIRLLVFVLVVQTSSVHAQDSGKAVITVGTGPNLSEVLELAMTKSPRIEAAEAELKSLESIRRGLLWSAANVNFTFQKAFGGTQVGPVFVPGNNMTQLGQIGMMFSPAIFFAYRKLASNIDAQKAALVAAQSMVGIELVKIWLDYYFLAGTTKSYQSILRRIDEISAQVTAGNAATKVTDLQRLSIQRNKMSFQLIQHKQAFEIARINYIKVIGKDPVPVPESKSKTTTETSDPAEGAALIDKTFASLKEGLKKTFPLPPIEEALKIANEKSPVIQIARFSEQAARTALKGEKAALFLPSVGLSRGRTSINGIQASLTNQTTLTLNWTIPFNQGQNIKSKAHELESSVLSSEAALRETEADLQIIYVQLANLENFWEMNIENFKHATVGLTQIGDGTDKITEKLDLLDALLESWAGQTGFNSLTTAVIMSKATAHAKMGTLFEQVELLKAMEKEERERGSN